MQHLRLKCFQVVFRSLVVAGRLVFTIAFTLSWIYGAGVLVFQKGALNWLFSVLKHTHQFYWMSPVMSFSVLTGLSLDYDGE